MVKEKLNWLDQQRVDVPHLRRQQNSIVSDFATLLNAFTATKPYILSGFNIANANSLIGQFATNVQVVVDSAKIWMPGFSDGSFLEVPLNTPNELLVSSNSKVVGSFTPNAVNFVSVQFTRIADPSTNDLVKFYDTDAKSEIAKTVPLGLVLNYQFVINTTGFGDAAPIAKVTLTGSNISSIENCKNSLFRLGTGGVSPDPLHNHQLTQEIENAITTFGANDPFVGGDWELKSFKDWMDRVMTRIKQLSGMPFWYTDSSSISNLNLLDTWNDTAGSIMTGNGRFIHSQLTAGDLSWTSPVVIKSIVGPREYSIEPGSVHLNNNQVAYISIIRNQLFDLVNNYQFTAGSTFVTPTTGTVPVSLLAGDYIKAVSDNEASWRKVLSINLARTIITLETNYPITSISQPMRSKGNYLIADVIVSDPENVPADSSTYWVAKRDIADTTSYSISTVSRTSDLSTINTTSTNTFVEGQSIYITGVTDSSFNGVFNVVSRISGTQFTVRNNGNDGSSTGGNVIAAARIYLRGLGELTQGEELQIEGQISNDTITYIGASSEVDNSPDYIVTSTGSLSLPNFNSTALENLTSRLSRVSAMHADRWQDQNMQFVRGSVVYNRANVPPTISISNAELNIPGVGNVLINTYSGTLTIGECLYVNLSRTSSAALTIQKSTLSTFIPSNNQRILYYAGQNYALFDINGVVPIQSQRIYEVDVVDPVSTTLPVSANPVIDGYAIQPNDTVLFTNLQNSTRNQIYIANSTGTLVASSTMNFYESDGSNGYSNLPANGSMIRVRKGASYLNQLGRFEKSSYSVVSVSRLSNVATYTISSINTISVGDTIEVSGVSDVSFNGTFQVTSVAGNSFTTSNAGSNTSSSGGTVSNNKWDFNDVVRNFSSNGNYFEQSSLKSAQIANNATTDIFTVPAFGSNNMIVDFSITRGITKETGQIYITHDGVTAETATANTSILLTGVTFNAVIFGSFITLRAVSDNSTTGTMIYSVKRWSDTPGGPAGLPGYNAVNTLNNGVLNSAFCISDGSGIENGCNAPTLVSGKTRVQLLWAYVPGVGPGGTVGDLEVVVNGQVFPRFITGVTLDGYYTEIDPYTIEFHTDLSITPISIEVIKKYGTYDFSTVNANRMRKVYDIIVGSPAQVLSGEADYSNINAAITAAPVGGKMLILQGTYTENVVITKKLMIEGKGVDTVINGTFVINSGSDSTIIRYLKVAANITLNSDKCILTEMWQTAVATVTDNVVGSSNYYLIIED